MIDFANMVVLVGKEDNFGGVTITANEAWPDANDAAGFKAALEVRKMYKAGVFLTTHCLRREFRAYKSDSSLATGIY